MHWMNQRLQYQTILQCNLCNIIKYFDVGCKKDNSFFLQTRQASPAVNITNILANEYICPKYQNIFDYQNSCLRLFWTNLAILIFRSGANQLFHLKSKLVFVFPQINATAEFKLTKKAKCHTVPKCSVEINYQVFYGWC